MFDLPNDDIHDQHVAHQPNDTHDGVQRGDDNRDDHRSCVAAVEVAGGRAVLLAPRVHNPRGAATVRLVPTQRAVEQHGGTGEPTQVNNIRTVSDCVLHGPCTAEPSNARGEIYI